METASPELRLWAAKEGLSPEIIGVLQEQGFTSLDEIKSTLQPDDIKAYFQDTQLLKVAQCLALKKAVTKFSAPSGAAPIQPSPAPNFSGPAPSQPSPAHNLSGPVPSQPSPAHNYLGPAPSQTYPAQYQQPTPGLYPNLPQENQNASQPVGWSVPGAQNGWDHAMASCAGAMGGVSMSESGREESFTFLLLGKTGSGKSTTGNTIFGQKLFNTAATFSSVTENCERKMNKIYGRKIEIIDSPGLYDTHKSQEEICVTIVQAVAGMHPGPHAVLYVVRLGRYTAEEYGAYTRLKALFDDSISKYMIVVFTHGDMLEREGRSIQHMIEHESPEDLKKVLADCNNRYIVFNNMAPNPQHQVEQLLSMVRYVVAENGGQAYSCPKYGQIGQGMEEEVARRLQEVEKRDLQRQKYVQELEKQTQEAEDAARQTKEMMEKKEEERRCRMEEEEERRRQLEEQLHTHMQEQREKARQHQEQLLQLQREREEQERMMREKENQMTERERQRAEEEAERMRQREEEMQRMAREQEERFQKQRQEDEARREQMEKERQDFIQQMEEQRQKERAELQEREDRRIRLLEERVEEERAEAKKKQELYEQEMESLKQSYFTKQQASEMASTAIGTIIDVVKIAISIYELTNKGAGAEAVKLPGSDSASKAPSTGDKK